MEEEKMSFASEEYPRDMARLKHETPFLARKIEAYIEELLAEIERLKQEKGPPPRKEGRYLDYGEPLVEKY